MPGQIVIRRDDEGLVRFNLLDEDGTVLSSSKGFDSVEAATAGVERAKARMAEAEVVDQTEGGNAVRSSPSVAQHDDG